MTHGGAADGAAVLPEFTVLRKPCEDNKYWYTAVHRGEPVVFRVLDDNGVDPVDGADYVTARVQAMQKHVQEVCVDVAAEHAYRAVLVEVSLLDDAMAIPEEAQRDMDCAVDLWSPLHVALMTSNKEAAQALLQFHVEHAVTAMTCIANTPSTIGGVGAVDTLDSLPAAPALVDGAPDAPGDGHAASAPPVAATPILECQLRRELGGAVVLIGRFDSRVRPFTSAAAHKSRPATPVEGESQHTAPVSSSPAGIANAIVSECHCSTGTAVGEDALLQSRLGRHNNALLREEDALFEDKGEEYCLRNILVAMRPLLQSIVLEVQRRTQCTTTAALVSLQHHPHTHKASRECATPVVPESAIDFVHEYCSSLSMLSQHPSLLIDGDTVFDVCNHGDVALLAKVMDVFDGCFAPILRGQTLLTDRCAGSRSVGGLALAGATVPHNSSMSTPPSLRATGQSSPPNYLSLGGDTSAHSTTGSSHKGSVGRPLHTLPPAPFWWSCPPQKVHHLAFIAVWLGLREAVEESSGSGRRRRAVSISNENRVTMATIRQLQESRVAVPKLDSTIWSGHLIIIMKLVSRECSLEDYVDFVEEGGYFTFTSPRGFSGLFLSVLVSGVMAAALVQEPAMLRVLRCKVETLLADVPGRPSPLRTYVMSRPSTHAERFRELWLDTGCHGAANAGGGSDQNNAEMSGFAPVGGIHSGERRPMKFRTRIELLYYVVVEQVASAAEEAWTMHEAEDGDSPEAAEGNAAPLSSLPWPSGATKAEALTALQGWLLMWSNFFTSLRDWTPHRGSFGHNFASSQMPQQERPSHSLISGAEGHLSVGGMALPLTTPNHQHTASSEDLFSDDTNETADTVQCVSHALVQRLETGQEPLPALRRALFPNDANNMETDAPDAGTSAHVGKALPISSIEQEFTAAQHAFAAMASKESNEVKLKFYGLFKQATIGDVNTERPGIFDYAGKAKWDAWSKLKGISLLDAKRMYVSEYKLMVELRRSQKQA